LEALNCILRCQATLIGAEDIRFADRCLKGRWLVDTGNILCRDLHGQLLELERTYERIGFGGTVYPLVLERRGVQRSSGPQNGQRHNRDDR
jgi:hypothetical protein